MNFSAVMNQVLVIFMIMVIGYILRKIDLLTRQFTKNITELLINVTIPAIIISSFDMELPASVIASAGIVFIFAMLSHGFAAILGHFLYKRYPHGVKEVMSFTAVFTNCAFMGYPVMESIFGGIGIFYASIYQIAFNIFLWTYGQVLFTGARDMKVIKKVLLNPGIIAVMVGLVLLLTSLELHPVLSKTSAIIGSMTTPLAMLVTGAMLAEVDLRKMFHGFYIYQSTVLRLVILPTAAFFILTALGVERLIASVCTMLTAMPAASNTVLFAEKFEGDSILASRIVALSTGLSIVSIPLIALLTS